MHKGGESLSRVVMCWAGLKPEAQPSPACLSPAQPSPYHGLWARLHISQAQSLGSGLGFQPIYRITVNICIRSHAAKYNDCTVQSTTVLEPMSIHPTWLIDHSLNKMSRVNGDSAHPKCKIMATEKVTNPSNASMPILSSQQAVADAAEAKCLADA